MAGGLCAGVAVGSRHHIWWWWWCWWCSKISEAEERVESVEMKGRLRQGIGYLYLTEDRHVVDGVALQHGESSR